MLEITKEWEINMLMKENALYSGLSSGGCSLIGEDISPTLIARYETQIGNTQDKLNVVTLKRQVFDSVMEKDMDAVVRRLTPLECERLQGYPEVDGKGWTDIGEWTDTKGKLHKLADSHRYKALGNSIALPYWSWMAERMVKQLKADGIANPTMASLFDGIGGFPLVYSRCGCRPVWASEIEEFPIAVTKIRFPESEGEDEKQN